MRTNKEQQRADLLKRHGLTVRYGSNAVDADAVARRLAALERVVEAARPVASLLSFHAPESSLLAALDTALTELDGKEQTK